jgi:hypothetical protein
MTGFGRVQSLASLLFELDWRLLCGDKLPLNLHKFEHSIGPDPAKPV